MDKKEVEEIKNIAGWYRLMQEAKRLGLSPDEVRIALKFLEEEK